MILRNWEVRLFQWRRCNCQWTESELSPGEFSHLNYNFTSFPLCYWCDSHSIRILHSIHQTNMFSIILKGSHSVTFYLLHVNAQSSFTCFPFSFAVSIYLFVPREDLKSRKRIICCIIVFFNVYMPLYFTSVSVSKFYTAAGKSLLCCYDLAFP